MRSMSLLGLLRPGFPARRAVAVAAAFYATAGILIAQESTLMATVVDERTGESVTGLGLERFSVVDGDLPLQVVSVSEPRSPFDVLLLVDTSMVGETVRPIAEALIEELSDDEAMAIVGYDERAELLQDFTSEKQFLRRALDRSRLGNVPRVHDALFASIDGGFDASANRKAVVLLSAGIAARGRTSEADVLEVARAKRASVYSVFVRNDARNLLRRLSLRTGGASFAARRLKLEPRILARRVMDAVRSPYELTVRGVLTLGDRLAATISSPKESKGRLTASILPVD